MIKLPAAWQLPQSMEDLVTHSLASGERKAVGIKQTLRALIQGRALQVYLAVDADAMLVEDIARERGCCKITLEVLEGNPVAQGSYRKFGFSDGQLDPAHGRMLFWNKYL